MKKILLILILLTGTLYAQPPIAQPNDLMVCDQNSDGTEVFNLSATTPEILNGLNPSLYTVRFYTTLINAQNNVAIIVNPTAFPNTTNPQTIYVRVFENANPANFAITDFDLIVNLPPAIAQPPNLIKYESPFDGIATFDLTSKQFITLNGISPATVSVTYHETETAAQLGISPIPSPTAYSNIINPQTIYVKVEDAITGCFAIKQFTLTVVLSNGVVYIPDANFKAKLLSADTTNQIASIDYDLNSPANPTLYNKIDVNNDGEIQFSEVQNIQFLNIQNSTINDLTGVEAFINLKELNCNTNQIGVIDMSQNLTLRELYCSSAGFFSLNVNQNSDLRNLGCSYNQITNLDVTQNLNLISLFCLNNSLSQIDTSQNSALEVLNVNYNVITSLDVSQNLNLKTLQCTGNLLTSIDVTPLVYLESLGCGVNSQINQINVTQNIGLKFLQCSGLGITSLDVSANINLIDLTILSSQLESLDMTQNVNLKRLNCKFSAELSNLNLSQNINLEELDCSFCDLTNLDLTQNINLEELDCSFNNLTNLDLSQNSNLYTVYCQSNQLESLNVKNGKIESLINVSNNLILEFICVDEGQNFSFIGLAGLDVVVNSYCSFNPGGDYNTITGTFQYDFNNSGCDSSDPNANYIGLAVSIDGISTNSSVYSNGLGVYNLFTSNPGVYGLTPSLENLSYFNVTPSPAEVPVMTIDNSTVTQNFCISANGVHPDLEVVIAPVIPARPGFQAVYKIVYKNKGNQVMSQNNGLNFLYNHNLMSLVSASAVPSAQATGGLQWDYANLMPFESRSILVTFLINAPTNTTNPVNIDDVLTFTAVVSPQAGDDNVTDNTFVFNQTVVGSYDPNDITCLQGNLVQPTLIGEYLHYMIRFENTGTAAAENIVVKTEIDATQYNINSLQMLAASHNATIKRTGNKIEFIFQNIQLDSGGHGNILLKIQSNGSLVEGDSVTESAAIYFDYNFPVITNDEETVFATLSMNNPNVDATVSLYPNPVKDVVTIHSASQIQSIQLYDVQGRLLQTMVIDTNEYQFNLSERKTGIYFVKITSDNGSKIEKIIKE